MTNEIDEAEEAWFMERLAPDYHKSHGGLVVETKSGKGQTKNGDPAIKDKIPVYLDDGRKILCSPQNIKLIGYWD